MAGVIHSTAKNAVNSRSRDRFSTSVQIGGPKCPSESPENKRSEPRRLVTAALKEDPGLSTIEPWVDDSGEGRWTVEESVELAVPLPVISIALQARFRSRQSEGFGFKMLAAMRKQFGGHAVHRRG